MVTEPTLLIHTDASELPDRGVIVAAAIEADRLLAAGWPLEQLPPEVVDVLYVSAYTTAVEKGGHARYFQHGYHHPPLPVRVQEALETVGTPELAEIHARAIDLLGTEAPLGESSALRRRFARLTLDFDRKGCLAAIEAKLAQILRAQPWPGRIALPKALRGIEVRTLTAAILGRPFRTTLLDA